MIVRRAALASSVAVATLLLPIGTADAGQQELLVDAQPSLDREVASFDLDYEDPQELCLAAPSGEAFAEGTDTAVDATFDFTMGGGSGLVTFGATVPAGYYDIVLTCDVGEGDISGTTSVAFARGHVVKAVEGEVPSDAEFVIDVSCTGEDDEGEPTAAAPFSLSFTYPSTGGEETFVVYSQQDCTVTETEDGGAEETTVEGTFGFPEPVDETVTVTNVFAAAVTPPTPPAPTAPPAAQPVVAAPAYTG
jgi:hypothetical protein